jgi:hypothetical protein
MHEAAAEDSTDDALDPKAARPFHAANIGQATSVADRHRVRRPCCRESHSRSDLHDHRRVVAAEPALAARLAWLEGLSEKQPKHRIMCVGDRGRRIVSRHLDLHIEAEFALEAIDVETALRCLSGEAPRRVLIHGRPSKEAENCFRRRRRCCRRHC